MNDKKYLSQKEVARILGVKVKTLNHWRCTKRHRIPFVKLGSVILYPTAEFFGWLKSHSSNLILD
ncbi:MAG: helix-turn-helix domain-containing protein [Alphaproteobacteria bacterium]|jgi:excisionase family DNA binding protein|nr:helix-turn-helix domain-containing protein [Alphaproteobacteria bacterium]